MVAAAILDLLKRKCDDASVSEMPFSVSVPFCANICNSAGVMSVFNGIKNGGVDFDLFPVASVYVPTKFRNCISTGG